MAIISYAQATEDVLLFDAPRQVAAEAEFYIDVGANNPEKNSVTKLLYEQGWHGIKIEPSPERFARLPESRGHKHPGRRLEQILGDHIIEAVEPNTLTATHPGWDQRVRDAGYQFVFSDVLNRYYMRSSLVLEMIRQPAWKLDDGVSRDYCAGEFASQKRLETTPDATLPIEEDMRGRYAR